MVMMILYTGYCGDSVSFILDCRWLNLIQHHLPGSNGPQWDKLGITKIVNVNYSISGFEI